MSRAGLILAGVLMVLFWAMGCTEGETSAGGGGSGASGTAGTGGAGGNGGTVGMGGTGGIRAPVVCGSFWEQPADAPLVSTECTYDLDAVPPIRDCTSFDSGGEATFRVIREYADDTVPCGYPCVTGNMPTGPNTGDHFDAALRSVVEAASFGPDGVTLVSRVVYTLDADGNLELSEVYDGDDNLTGTGTTTYTYVGTGPNMGKPETFETRLGNDLVVDGSMMWNANGQLEAFEVTLHVITEPHSRFDYAYNGDGTLMEVTAFDLKQDPEKLLSTFEFAYPFPQVTVTYVLADSTTQSILTYDFVCGP